MGVLVRGSQTFGYIVYEQHQCLMWLNSMQPPLYKGFSVCPSGGNIKQSMQKSIKSSHI